MVHFEHCCLCCWRPDTSENRSEIPRKSRNVVLERNGNQLEKSREKCRNILFSQGGNGNPTYNKRVEGQIDWSHLA